MCVCVCVTINRDAALRLLNVPNMHNTGHIHGVLPAHVGMRVRFMVKLNSTLGLVQEQKATVVDFLFKDEDRARYNGRGPGEIFRPQYQPAGIWLQVDDFQDSPIWKEALLLDQDLTVQDAAREDANRVKNAKSLFLFAPVEAEFTWRSTETHNVKRQGFALSHANYLTSTASQGQTLRLGVTIDCARVEPAPGRAGSSDTRRGKSDDDWWLHLYVMLSRATCMADMLLLRPPPRALLERGPPPGVKKALEQFEAKIEVSTADADALAAELGFELPA